MNLKYAAIVTYTTGGCAGVTVRADSLSEAWSKLLAALNGGANIQAIQLGEVLTDKWEIK